MRRILWEVLTAGSVIGLWVSAGFLEGVWLALGSAVCIGGILGCVVYWLNYDRSAERR